MKLEPGKQYELRDDAQARALLAELGLLERLDAAEAEGGLSKTLLLSAENHPTHWVMAARFYGHALKADNGYVVFLLPKSRVPRADFEKELAAQSRHYFPSGPEATDWTRKN